jgi:tetraacyldisaccharide 4'-kinase
MELSIRRHPCDDKKMIVPPTNRALFYAPAKLYELAVRARIVAYERKLLKTYQLNAPVISVGNLTVGGTGKTPCVAFIANCLRDAGHQAAILSRGYKRESQGRVEVSNKTEILCSPRESGDEPFLLAQTCPGVRVVVDADRYAAGHWLAEQAQISVFILDDAFQHLRLARDLNLVLIDATEPLAEARMVPFGRLREPLDGLRRADAVIITRSDQSFDRASLIEKVEKHSRPNTPVFFASHQMTTLRRLGSNESFAITDFVQRAVAAVCGIAKPDRFNGDLQQFGMRIVLRRDFEDHHRYSAEEFAMVIRDAQSAEAEAVIVTEKDAANLPDKIVANSPLPVYAAQIEFQCEQETALRKLLLQSASKSKTTNR